MSKELARTQMIERIFKISDMAILASEPKMVYLLIHELQQIYLTMLMQCLPTVEGLDSSMIKGGEEVLTVKDFTEQVIHRTLLSRSKGLAFNEAMEAYISVGTGTLETNSDLPPLDFSDKRTVLSCLQVAHAVILRGAIGELAQHLNQSGSIKQKQFAAELLHEHPSTSFSPARELRAQATDTTLGAGNDGITHFAAIVDVLWEKHKRQPNFSLEEVLREARKMTVPLMTKYQSWEVQLLDTLLLAEVNPYFISKKGEVVENESAMKFRKYVERLNNQAPMLSTSAFPRVVQDAAVQIGLDRDIRQAAVVVAKAAASLTEKLGPTGMSEYMGIVSSYDAQEKRQRLEATPHSELLLELQSMDDAMLMRASAVAQIPIKIIASTSERLSSSRNHDPRCMLLNVPDGYPDWTTALIDITLELAKK